MTLKNNRRNGFAYLSLKVQCKCDYCEPDLIESETSTGGEYQTTTWTITKKSDCMCGTPPCVDCCCNKIQGRVTLRGQEYDDVVPELLARGGETGDLAKWPDLARNVAGWIDSGAFTQSGDVTCNPPLPSGWVYGIFDVPSNLGELDCCR